MTNRLRFFVALLALVLAACGRKEEAKVATQVAAKVNATEITVHQINRGLARSPGVTPDNAAQAKREILDGLINQELAKREAILKGLDRSSSVILDIEAARNEILARAYRESLVDYLPKPAAYEVETYYRKHPELFAERRVFSLEELHFTANNDVAAGVREQVAKSRSLKEVAEWLQSRGIGFAANRGMLPAEEIPLEILPKVQQMKQGEMQLFPAGGPRFRLIRVVAFQAAPVDQASAAARIRQFLFNQNAAEVIAKQTKELRASAKIEYLGEFAPPTAEREAKGGKESEGPATAEQTPKEQPAVRTRDR